MTVIRVRTDLPHHDKVEKMAFILNKPVATTVGHLVTLWCDMMDREIDDGVLAFTEYSPKKIARMAAWKGNPDLLMKALVGCGEGDDPGLLEITDEGYLIHGWLDLQGPLLSQRDRNLLSQQRHQARLHGTPEPPLKSSHRCPIETENAVGAFDFCMSPSIKSKSNAIYELIRQGVAESAIIGSATNPARRKWGFWDHIQILTPRKSRGAAASEEVDAWVKEQEEEKRCNSVNAPYPSNGSSRSSQIAVPKTGSPTS